MTFCQYIPIKLIIIKHLGIDGIADPCNFISEMAVTRMHQFS